MRRILLAVYCFSIANCLFGQEPSKLSLAPCGTPTGISPFLMRYDANQTVADRSEDTLWVGLAVHLLAKDNGSGRFLYDRFLDAFCRLNEDFGPANIQFYLKYPVNFINNTGWHTHSTIPQGIDMMLTNNKVDALNTYFVADPAGNCGYNLPYGGVAIAHSCAGAGDHTWAHEVGHALSLPHPFIGWEGKVYSSALPTPELLTYDYTYFHDTLETQVPAPLDTALVEYLDGSNCAIASDRICDSKPDYLSYRWNCDTQTGMSPGILKDPAGASFNVDGSLFMSYSDDACQNRFTDGQIAVMRATLLNEKEAWLGNNPSLPAVSTVASPIEPVQDAPVPVVGAKLVWAKTPNATAYLVQASRLTNFSYKEVDVVTTDTSVTCGSLFANKKYYWKVRPYNEWRPCGAFSPLATFTTVEVSSTYSPDFEGWRCYPSLLAPGQALQMEIPERWRGEEGLVQCYDIAGRLVFQAYLQFYAPKMNVNLPSETWQSGMYRMLLSSDRGVKQQMLFLK